MKRLPKYTPAEVRNDPYGFTYKEMSEVIGENEAKALYEELYKQLPRKKNLSMLSYSERHNRKIVFAYLLLPGINDRPSDVRQLAKWFRGKKVMINVLQYNPTSNSRIKAPQKREIVAFKHQLEQAGLEVTMRVSHGREINAACGQLANTYNKFKKND